MPNFSLKINKLTRLWFVVLLFAATGLNSHVALPAQRMKESSVRFISIVTSLNRNGTVVTLYADTPLTRTQTWKDSEGFHIVLLDAWQSMVKKVPPGIRVRRVSRALEILLQTREDADVKVQPLFNRLELLVSGGLDTSRRDDFFQAPIQNSRGTGADESSFKEPLSYDKGEQRSAVAIIPDKTSSLFGPGQATTPSSSAPTDSSVYERVWTSRQTSTPTTNYVTPSLSLAESTQRNALPVMPVQGNASRTASPVKVPSNVPTIAYDDDSDLPRSQVKDASGDTKGGLSAIFSPGGVVAFFGSGMLLLLFLRHRNSVQTQSDEASIEEAEEIDEIIGIDEIGEIISAKPAKRNKRLKASPRTPGQSSNSRPAKLTLENAASTLEMRSLELTLDEPQPAHVISSPATSANLFSVERIKQEVGMLVKDLPYSSDVISSRAAEDRRNIEACLVEAANAPDLNEEDRERARRALEEHGFVVRRGSVLLSAPAAAERALAARTLAEMHSPSSMPFLLEALYDAESTVRMEAINSLGTLKTPSAIGALMDVAFRHPDTSVSILSDVLKACSFEDFDSFDTPGELFSIPDAGGAEEPETTAFVSDIGDLPESVDDQDLTDALAQLEAVDTDVRAMAARVLGQFPVKRSVRELTSLALSDTAAAVRAAAVASLGDINHESVFAHLLIAFSDESREVQAAAARSLSSLSIDRTEAYAQLLEISDEATLRDVARACSKTGMVSQAVDRLVSPDRRQAHESFLLLSLLAKVNETEAIINAVEDCKNSNARMAAIGLFGLSDLLKLEPAVSMV
jgi:hypothetical protein